MDKTILIADDDQQILSLLAEVFRQQGYRVCEAENGQQALEIAKAELPSVAILDISMPDKSGTDVCKAIKNEPATKHIPIVMLSGNNTLSEIQKAMCNGACSYVTKPCGAREITDAVEAAICRSKQVGWGKLKRETTAFCK